MDALSKFGKAPVTLPSWEQVHIMRDPHRSIHTRKHEPVNTAEVMNDSRSNIDRVSENIQQFARGVNPMVSVSYSNHGNGASTNTIKTGQSFNPYGVMKDGVFRPPMFRQEDILPLSRQKREWFSTHARVGANDGSGFQFKNLSEMNIDKDPIRAAVHPTAAFNTGKAQEPWATNAVIDPLAFSVISGMTGHLMNDRDLQEETVAPSKGIINDHVLQSVLSSVSGYQMDAEGKRDAVGGTIVIRPSYSVASGYGVPNSTVTITNTEDGTMTRHIKDRPLQSYLSPGFTLAVMDETSRQLNMIKMPDKDIMRIASRVNANAPIEVTGEHGQPIKLKDYLWTVYQTATGSDLLVLEPTDRVNVHLDPKTPHYSVTSNIQSQMRHNPEVLAPILDNNRPIVSAFALPNRPNVHDNEQRDIRLPNRLQLGGFNNQGTVANTYRADLNPTIMSGGISGGARKGHLRRTMRMNDDDR